MPNPEKDESEGSLTQQLQKLLQKYSGVCHKILIENRPSEFPIHLTERNHHSVSIELIEELMDHLAEGPIIHTK